jgi:hypothetical protein
MDVLSSIVDNSTRYIHTLILELYYSAVYYIKNMSNALTVRGDIH